MSGRHQPVEGADSDPREYRISPGGVAHIRRFSNTTEPWSTTNGIMLRGGIPSYCGRDVSLLTLSWGWQDRTCGACLRGYFADDEAE
jgi:hypothetical protein